MNQTSIFDFLYDTFKIEKPIRLIEFFAGIGSQAKALKNLNANFEHWHICEWAIPSILAYNEIHHNELPKYGIDYSKDLTKEEIVEYLFKRGVSINYNEPAKLEQIKRMQEDKLRNLYNAIISTNNLVNVQETHGKDLEIVDKDKYCYMLSYSFPCQDLSLAGLGKGMSRDAGTRSGMLWEVERILDECSELGTLPNVLLMENVPQVIGANAINDFQEWRAKLESLGYSNYVEVLNAKDFGIPQSRERCFMVSILGEYNYTFPSKIPLTKKLKDVLEKNVDEKYYLSDKQINQIMHWNAQQEPFETMGKEISPTLTTRSCAYAGGMILTSDLDDYQEEKEIGQQLMNMKRMLCNKLIQDGDVEEGDVIKHSYTQQILEGKKKCVEKSDGIMITLTTRPDCVGVVVKDENEDEENMWTETQLKMLTPDGNVKRYIDSDIVDEFKEGQAADISFPNGYGHGKRTFDECPTLNTTSAKSNFIVKEEKNDTYLEKKYKQFINENGYIPEIFQPYNNYEVTDVAPTVLASCGNPGGVSSITIKSNLRIRKLTPKETYRLMGFSDEDYENASKVCSDALIWHQAGDSIVVNVLMAIFKEML